jgi:hypothetical protein
MMKRHETHDRYIGSGTNPNWRIWLRAQQSEPENIAKASASEETHNARCEATCALKHSSQNLASLLVWPRALTLPTSSAHGCAP